jgi:hypothetical protein
MRAASDEMDLVSGFSQPSTEVPAQGSCRHHRYAHCSLRNSMRAYDMKKGAAELGFIRVRFLKNQSRLKPTLEAAPFPFCSEEIRP